MIGQVQSPRERRHHVALPIREGEHTQGRQGKRHCHPLFSHEPYTGIRSAVAYGNVVPISSSFLAGPPRLRVYTSTRVCCVPPIAFDGCGAVVAASSFFLDTVPPHCHLLLVCKRCTPTAHRGVAYLGSESGELGSRPSPHGTALSWPSLAALVIPRHHKEDKRFVIVSLGSVDVMADTCHKGSRPRTIDYV